VYRCGREFRSAPILLAQIRRIVVSQTIIQREFASHLPGVLRIEPELLFAHARTSWVRHLYLIDQTQKETGVTESDVGADDRRALEGLAGFCRREGINTVGIAVNDRRVSLRAEFRTEFVAMIVSHPV